MYNCTLKNMQNYNDPKLEPLLSMIYLVFTDHACAQREFVTVFVFVHFCLCICVCVFLFVYCCLQWFMRRRRFLRPSACSSSGSENIQSDWSDLLTGARNERFSENNQSQLHQKSRIKLELSPFFFFRNWFLPCPAKMHLQAFVSLPQPCRSAARQLCHQFCSTIIAKPISAPDSDQRLWLTNALRLFSQKILSSQSNQSLSDLVPIPIPIKWSIPYIFSPLDHHHQSQHCLKDDQLKQLLGAIYFQRRDVCSR